VSKAFAVFDIPSVQEQLSAIITFWLEMADQLTNLPMMLQGIAAADTSPDTLGGMQMLLNNMTAPLRVIAKQFDDYLIVPHLTRYHHVYMQDPEVPGENKGDSQIKARGATALVQRAEGAEFLAMLYPAVKEDPTSDISPQKILIEMARSKGYNLTTIKYTEEEKKERDANMAQMQPAKDPRVEAAQIRTDAVVKQAEVRAQESKEEREFKAAEAEKDRQAAAQLREVDRQIEMMELSGQQNISLTQIKAMLAGKAMDARLKTDEMRLKVSPANPSNQGI
jgi:hypothetical protein